MAPLILGLVLGKILEQSLRRALSLSAGDATILWSSHIAITFWIQAAAAIVNSNPSAEVREVAAPGCSGDGLIRMGYLISTKQDRTPAGELLRMLLQAPDIVRMPGAHNGLATLQAKVAGFKALYLSGAAMSASMGLPDLGILTLEDALFFTRQIVRASGLPLLVDGDTGFGES